MNTIENAVRNAYKNFIRKNVTENVAIEAASMVLRYHFPDLKASDCLLKTRVICGVSDE